MSKGKTLDLKGLRFGKLLVLEQVDSIIISGRKRTAWKCICDCGIEKVIASNYLMKGSSRSCGCGEYIRKSKDTIECLYTYAKDTAKRTKSGKIKNPKEFSLTLEEFKGLVLLDCHYCGRPPSNQYRQVLKGGDRFLTYSGIDRMDSTQGYIPGNCVPCCFICNTMKNNLSYSDFVEHISLLYKRLCLPKPIS